MLAFLSVASIAAALVVGNNSFAACPSGQWGNCVDLGLVPEISKQIVVEERIPAAKPTYRTDADTPYTGPIVGVAPTVVRAPTIGYQWALH